MDPFEIPEKQSMIHIMILSHLLSLRAIRIEFRNIIARVERLGRRESEFLKVCQDVRTGTATVR